jgi:hypothetical protein
VRSIESPSPRKPLARRISRLAGMALALNLSACSLLSPDKPGSSPTPAERPGQGPGSTEGATSSTKAPRFVKLPPPKASRNWAELRRQAAERLVAANPDGSYMGKPPFMLLAIPVMTIELNADGSVRHISVMRHPSQAKDTVQLAIQAIQRAAPFGDVSKLPKPWKFNETFLFKEDRKFKPMTLDRAGS